MNDNVQVLSAMIRKYVPLLLAQDILGVQPMTGPAGSVFQLRAKYSYSKRKPFKMSLPDYYKHFLRLNNRKRAFTQEEYEFAGYTVIDLTDQRMINYYEIHEWCENTFTQGSWVSDGNKLFAFSREEQATLFKLAWCDNIE